MTMELLTREPSFELQPPVNGVGINPAAVAQIVKRISSCIPGFLPCFEEHLAESAGTIGVAVDTLNIQNDKAMHESFALGLMAQLASNPLGRLVKRRFDAEYSEIVDFSEPLLPLLIPVEQA
jgi:hypothetical protein